MAKIAGTVYVRVDGKQMHTKGGVEVPLSSVKREAIVADDGDVNSKEEKTAGYVKATVLITPDFPLSAITNGVDQTVTVELANGMTYVLSKAFLTDEPSMKSDSGEAEISWAGNGEWQ